MKKGFTLMELLGSVVIMSIVLGIATISVVAIINNAKQKAYNTQVSLILAKSKDWALANETKLTPDGGINFIELSTLVSSGYVDNTTISDPRNGSTMSGCVVIIYNSTTSQYEYKYSDSACSAEQEKYGPEWTSSNPTEVEVGSTYQYGVVTAKSRASNNALLTVTGPTINIVKDNTIVKAGVDNLDTSYVRRTYSLTYSAYDPIYKYTFNKTYYVEVKDKVPPIITLGETSGTEESKVSYIDTKDTDGQADIYVLTENNTKYPVLEMKINDDSCDGLTEDARTNNNCEKTFTITKSIESIDLTKAIDKLYASPVDVTYTATDSSGNVTHYILHYYVSSRSFVYNSPTESDFQIYYPHNYLLEGSGAQGGNSNGGAGGYVSGEMKLNFGDIIHVSVGNIGGGGSAAAKTKGSAAGGKSTRIFRNGDEILRAAGGGAGGSTAGGIGGTGTGAGGNWPAVCSGSFGPAQGGPVIAIDPDPTHTNSSGNLVCPDKKSDANPNPPNDCSAAKGGDGSNGSGGGSSGSLTFSAHQCKAVQDYCRQWNTCQDPACGHIACPNESACGCAEYNSCQDPSCGQECTGGTDYQTCYACYYTVCTSSHYYCDTGYLIGRYCAASLTAVGNNTSWDATEVCDSYGKKWYECKSEYCGEYCLGWSNKSCQNSSCSCNTAATCVNDSCELASCETSGCKCKVWNYKDDGTWYDETSYGYGGQGGTSAVYNGLDRKDDGTKTNTGDGKASITVK